MITTIACEDKDKRMFDMLLSQHAVSTNRKYSQPEFFALLLERWRMKK